MREGAIDWTASDKDSPNNNDYYPDDNDQCPNNNDDDPNNNDQALPKSNTYT